MAISFLVVESVFSIDAVRRLLLLHLDPTLVFLFPSIEINTKIAEQIDMIIKTI